MLGSNPGLRELQATNMKDFFFRKKVLDWEFSRSKSNLFRNFMGSNWSENCLKKYFRGEICPNNLLLRMCGEKKIRYQSEFHDSMELMRDSGCAGRPSNPAQVKVLSALNLNGAMIACLQSLPMVIPTA